MDLYDRAFLSPAAHPATHNLKRHSYTDLMQGPTRFFSQSLSLGRLAYTNYVAVPPLFSSPHLLHGP